MREDALGVPVESPCSDRTTDDVSDDSAAFSFPVSTLGSLVLLAAPTFNPPPPRPRALSLSPPLQAQEKGEHVQVLDDAVYALDGMAPSCGLGTQRESITTLAELLSTRRGRAALRCACVCLCVSVCVCVCACAGRGGRWAEVTSGRTVAAVMMIP